MGIMGGAKRSAVAGLLLTGLTGWAFAGGIDSRLKERLAAGTGNAEVPVIVRMSGRADVAPLAHGLKKDRVPRIVKALKEKAERSQVAVRGFLRRGGAKEERVLWIANAIAATVKTSAIEELAAQPGVESVALDESVPAPVTLAGGEAPPEWNLAAVHAPELWTLGFTGQGVVVASMDSGVDINHPDLKSRWRGGTNSWFDPYQRSTVPYDTPDTSTGIGHGTGTMGVMVGGSSGGTAIGMAPGATWVAVKIFSDADYASESAIHAGYQWLLDPDGNPDTDDAPDVVNNSWGAGKGMCDPEFADDVVALRAAGIAMVFAAGNDGPYDNTSVSPANYPQSFAVGSVGPSLTVSSFSGRGPSACDQSMYPELVAPGAQIRIADLTAGGVLPYSYTNVKGTSFAAPHVAGAMALLQSAYPGLSVSQLEAALINGATDLGPSGPDNSYGGGLLDVAAAYRLLLPFEVSDAGHDFGTVNSGELSAPFVFTVANRSEAPLYFEPAGLETGSEFALAADGCSGRELEAGGECGVTVAYRPLSEGNHQDHLILATSTGAGRLPLPISLKGGTFSRVTLLQPNGGERIMTGTPVTVSWGRPLRAATFNLSYSLDNGFTWKPIATGVSGTSFQWTAPPLAGQRSGCRVQVKGLSVSGVLVSSDRSDRPFVIYPVRVLGPQGGEVYTSGTKLPVSWEYGSTVRPTATIRVQLTMDGGITWRSIAILPAGAMAYEATVPTVSSRRSACRVRVQLLDAAGRLVGSDSSDHPFTISP
jgi:bacillopeptidase F